jgi:hypothetical protein
MSERQSLAVRFREAPAPDLPLPAIVAAAALLLWPAAWNGYPLVFSDTGTYLTQAIEHHLGWDRPAFYSLAIFPLHMTLSTWPVIAAQALLAATVLHLLRRVLLRAASSWWLVPLCGVLAVASAAPWFVAQLMPDLFTPLLVVTNRLGRFTRYGLVGLSAFMIAAHQSNLPLALAVLGLLGLLRRRLGATGRLGRRGILLLAAAPALACAALLAMNLAGQGRLSLSPYGNVFLLARVIGDGPGRLAMQRDCPQAGWRLCAWSDAMPDNADDFLWRPDSPLAKAGGARAVSAEASAIVAAALRIAPAAEARAALANFLAQLADFATGDGLNGWPDTVAPPIARDFPPAEAAAYDAARQTNNTLTVPAPLAALHVGMALVGVLGCAAVLTLGWRRHVGAGFAAAALFAVLVNAAVTGCLSGPHDRYQSRIMGRPRAIALPALPAVLARRAVVAGCVAPARRTALLPGGAD